MKFNYKSRKGFTLIELLVVIGILAVLAAIRFAHVLKNTSLLHSNSNDV